eukprot:3828890-Prorocentrum_lima.AAC.1
MQCGLVALVCRVVPPLFSVGPHWSRRAVHWSDWLMLSGAYWWLMWMPAWFWSGRNVERWALRRCARVTSVYRPCCDR